MFLAGIDKEKRQAEQKGRKKKRKVCKNSISCSQQQQQKNGGLFHDAVRCGDPLKAHLEADSVELSAVDEEVASAAGVNEGPEAIRPAGPGGTVGVVGNVGAGGGATVELADNTLVLVVEGGARGSGLGGAIIPGGDLPVPHAGLGDSPAGGDASLVGVGDLLDVTAGVVDTDHAGRGGVHAANAAEVDVPGSGNDVADADDGEVGVGVPGQDGDAADNGVGGAIPVGGAASGLVVEHDLVSRVNGAVEGGEEELVAVVVGVVHEATRAEAAAEA